MSSIRHSSVSIEVAEALKLPRAGYIGNSVAGKHGAPLGLPHYHPDN